MEFFDIVHHRYATKKFDGNKIPQDKIERLMEIIRLAPSSYNIQPWFIAVVTDQKTKDAIQAVAWNQPQVGSSSHLFVFCADVRISHKIDLLEKVLVEGGAEKDTIQGYIQLMRDFENKMDDDKKKHWAQRQLYLALGNAVNGAKSLGFDSCPMEGFDPAAVSTILNLPAHIIPTALCPVGYAADSAREKIRFPLAEVFG